MAGKDKKKAKRVNRSPYDLLQAEYEKSQLKSMPADDGYLDALASQGAYASSEPEPPPMPAPSLPDDGSLVLTVAEVCVLLKISRRTLERSDVPGKVKVGGSVRYHKGVLEQWLNQQVLT